ncbi:MAG: DUF86 domain-containing protein [Anaerolineales bacterium]|nr:DUF86 domain-containing protein [Anaerolineales bacterium]
MSKFRTDNDFLLDIQDALQRILEYTAGMNWETYLRDYKTQDAVVRNLEVIGEATKSLSDSLRSQYPDIPWRDMAGTRDRLMYHYFGVNQEIVWQIIEQDLPGLKSQIEQVIHDLPVGNT